MNIRLDTRARQVIALREKKDAAKLAHDEAKEASAAFEAGFWEELEAFGLKTFVMNDGTRITRNATPYHDMLNVDELHEWAKENGMADEWFGKAPRKGALNEYIKTARENGNPLPPGLGERTNRFLSVTKPPAK